MKTDVYTIGEQSASLYIPDHHNKVCVSLSAGTDSTLVLYLICSYIRENRKDVSVLLMHCVDIVRTPYSERDFNKVASRFIEQFPEIQFDKYVYTYVETKGFSKGMRTNKEIPKIIREHGIQSFFFGKTKNPPKEVCEQLGELRPALLIREGSVITPFDICKMFDKDGKPTEVIDDCVEMRMSPLFTVDRSFVADFYRKVEFLKNIFPLTASCVGGLVATKNWTTPCKKCWWCKEKFWAFHQYDGGSL